MIMTMIMIIVTSVMSAEIAPTQNMVVIIIVQVVWLLLKPFHNYKYLNKTKEVAKWDFGVL